MAQRIVTKSKACKTMDEFYKRYLPKSYEAKRTKTGDPEEYGAHLAMQSIKNIQKVLGKTPLSK